MAQDKRVFTGGMDKDSEPRLIKQGDYRDALNVRNIASSNGTSGSIENIEGNRVVPYTFTEEEYNVVDVIDEGISDPIPNSEVIFEQKIIITGRELDGHKCAFTVGSYNEEANIVELFGLSWEGNQEQTAAAGALYAAFGPGGYLSSGITIIDVNTGAIGTAHAEVDFGSNQVLNDNSLTVTIIADEANFDFDLDFSSPNSAEFNQLWSSTVNQEYFGEGGHLNINTQGAVYLGSELNFETPSNVDDIFTGEPLPPVSDDVTQLLFTIEGQEPTLGQSFDSDIGGNLNVYSFIEDKDGGFDVLPFFSLAGGLFDSGASHEFDSQQDSISEALTDKFTDFSAPVLVAGRNRPILLKSFISSFGYGSRLQGDNSSVTDGGEEASIDDFSLIQNYINIQDTGSAKLGPGATIANGIIKFKGRSVQSGRSYNFSANIQEGESYIISFNTTAIDSGLSFRFKVGEETSPVIESIGAGTFQFVAKSTVSHFSIVPEGDFGDEDELTLKALTLSTLLAPESSLKTVIQGGTSFAFNLCFGISEEAVKQHLEEGNPPTTYINLIDGKLAAKILPYSISLSEFNDNAPTSEELLFTIQELEDEIIGLESQLFDLTANYNSELESIQEYVTADSATADSIIAAIQTAESNYEGSAFNINEVEALLNAEVGAYLDSVELIRNGDFSDDSSEWSLNGWLINNFSATTNTGGASLSQTLDIFPNQAYNYSIYANCTDGALELKLGDATVIISSTGKHEGTLTPTSGGVLELVAGSRFTGSVDDISIQLVSINTLTPSQLIGIYNTHIDNLNGALALMSSLIVDLEDANVVNAELQGDLNDATDEISTLNSDILALESSIENYQANYVLSTHLQDAQDAYANLVAGIAEANRGLSDAISVSGTNNASITTAIAAYQTQLTIAGINASYIVDSLTALNNNLQTALDNEEDGVSQEDVDAVQAELDAANAAFLALQESINSESIPDFEEMLITNVDVDEVLEIGAHIGQFDKDYGITTTTGAWIASSSLAASEFDINDGKLIFTKDDSHNAGNDYITTDGFTGVFTPTLTAGNYVLSLSIDPSPGSFMAVTLSTGDTQITNLMNAEGSLIPTMAQQFTVTPENAADIAESGYGIKINITNNYEFDNISIVKVPADFNPDSFGNQNLFDLMDSTASIPNNIDIEGLQAEIEGLEQSNDNLSQDMINLIGLISNISTAFSSLESGTLPDVIADLTLQSTASDTISFTSDYNEQTNLLSSLINTLNSTITALNTQIIDTEDIEEFSFTFPDDGGNEGGAYATANSWIHTGSLTSNSFFLIFGTSALIEYPLSGLVDGNSYTLTNIAAHPNSAGLFIDTGEGTEVSYLPAGGQLSDSVVITANENSDRIRIYSASYAQLYCNHTLQITSA